MSGDYPEGQAEFPVTGVSWFEADAYAAFVGKALPTVYHWTQAAGLPLPELLEALSAGAAGSWVLANRAGNMVEDSYPLGFKLSLHRKDVAIALDEARRLGVHLAVSDLVLGEEDELIVEGFGDEDVSALARIAKRRPDPA